MRAKEVAKFSLGHARLDHFRVLIRCYCPGVNVLTDVLMTRPELDNFKTYFDLVALLSALFLTIIIALPFSVDYEELSDAQSRWMSAAADWVDTPAWGYSKRGDAVFNPFYHSLAIELCRNGDDLSCLENDDLNASTPQFQDFDGILMSCQEYHDRGEGCWVRPGCCRILLRQMAGDQTVGKLFTSYVPALSKLTLVTILAILGRVFMEFSSVSDDLWVFFFWKAVCIGCGVLLLMGIWETVSVLDRVKWVKFPSEQANLSYYRMSWVTINLYLILGLVIAVGMVSLISAYQSFVHRRQALTALREIPGLSVKPLCAWSPLEVSQALHSILVGLEPTSSRSKAANWLDPEAGHWGQVLETLKTFDIGGAALVELSREDLKEMEVPLAFRALLFKSIQELARLEQLCETYVSRRDRQGVAEHET